MARRIALLVTALLAVLPLWLTAAIAEDSLLGERAFLLELEVSSRRRLALRAGEAMLGGAPYLLGLALLSFGLARALGRRAVWAIPLVGLAGAGLGFALSRSPAVATPALALTGLAHACLVVALIPRRAS